MFSLVAVGIHQAERASFSFWPGKVPLWIVVKGGSDTYTHTHRVRKEEMGIGA